MIVTVFNFDLVLPRLREARLLALDTEATGLRPFHGDRFFSIALADETDTYYFNFQKYPEAPEGSFLPHQYLYWLREVLEIPRTWVMHNASFDWHMLATHGIFLDGIFHDTKVAERLLKNDAFEYSLATVAERYGYEKSDAVEEWISKEKLWEWVKIPGKKTRTKDKRYRDVPFAVIAPYGERDARITYDIGARQARAFRAIDEDAEIGGMRRLSPLWEQEKALTEALFHVERRGVLLDRAYTEEALAHENRRYDDGTAVWLKETGREWLDSGQAFAAVLPPSGALTATGRVSYDADALEGMAARGEGLAKLILEIRDAKKRSDFLQGFLYHADLDGVLHPSLDQAGTVTGRFSCRDPNLQQLTKEEASDGPYPIRRALVPRPGFSFVMLDYDQVEFRLMLDYAGRYTQNRALIEKVLAGTDVHQATADIAGISRRDAKMVNFLTIYGGGNAKLAAALGCSDQEAARIRGSVFDAAPEIQVFMRKSMKVAEQRGYVVNWLGRRWLCEDSRFAYKAPNALIQGGCADVMKKALVEVHRYLYGKLTRIVLTIHDEIVLELAADERYVVPAVKEIMEKAYTPQYLPLTVGVDFSERSLADKAPWPG